MKQNNVGNLSVSFLKYFTQLFIPGVMLSLETWSIVR